jgi:micrococcal nuclease
MTTWMPVTGQRSQGESALSSGLRLPYPRGHETPHPARAPGPTLHARAGACRRVHCQGRGRERRRHDHGLRDGRTQVKIRLHGIDAPENGQDFGSRAKQATSELAFGKTVTILPRDTDRYGRTVADVDLPDGRSLNHELVSQGMAWWYREYAPDDRELARLEAGAKAARRGLWSVSGAVPPWDYREGVGLPVTAGAVGNRNSRVYHRPNCASIARMSEKNRVTFASRAEAEKAGYRKAGDCR